MSKKKDVCVNDALRRERLEHGWSQQDLADQLGTTVVTVNRWERGIQQPNPFLRLKLCTLFGKSASELGLYPDTPSETHSTPSSPEMFSDTSTSLEETPSEELAGEQQDSLEDKSTPLSLNASGADELSISDGTSAQRDRRTLVALSKTSWWKIVGVIVVLLGGSGLLSVFIIQKTSVVHPVKASFRVTAMRNLSLEALKHIAPTIADTFSQVQTQGQWVEGRRCILRDGAYHVVAWSVAYCGANKRAFKDFAYQIDMALVEGPQAGIDFRADADSHLYYLHIDAQGHYGLDIIDAPMKQQTLLEGFSPVLNRGYHHLNTLTVIVVGTRITIFFNQQRIGQVQDRTYDIGYLGVMAGSYRGAHIPGGQLTSAMFQNVKIWDLSSLEDENSLSIVTRYWSKSLGMAKRMSMPLWRSWGKPSIHIKSSCEGICAKLSTR